jgi:hypothetical protein
MTAPLEPAPLTNGGCFDERLSFSAHFLRAQGHHVALDEGGAQWPLRNGTYRTRNAGDCAAGFRVKRC